MTSPLHSSSAAPPHSPSSWRCRMSPELRRYLVSRVLKAFGLDIVESDMDRHEDLRASITAARQFEQHCFNFALTQREYYEMMAERVLQLERERRARVSPAERQDAQS